MSATLTNPTPTKPGWIPEELDTVCDRIIVGLATSVTEYYRECGIPIIRNTNIKEGYFDDTEMLYLDPAFCKKQKNKAVKPKDVVTVRTGSNIGLTCLVPEHYTNAQTFTTLIITTNPDKLLPEYLVYHMNSDFGKNEITRLQVGGGKNNLNSGDLVKYQILLPPPTEQKLIAEILSAWDDAIAKTEGLITAKTQLKKALIQRLLTGQLRFSEFSSEPWIAVSLGNIFKNRVESGYTSLELLSVTNDRGVIKRDELVKRDTSSDDKSKYLRVLPGDIAYNTMRMWQGVSGYSELEGIVSPAYTIVTPTDDIDGKFASYLFKLPQQIHEFYRHSQGLVDDTLNLKFHHFSKVKAYIPTSIEEQKKIAQTLIGIEQEITLINEQLATLKLQKKGLMQQLLTGKVRVKV